MKTLHKLSQGARLKTHETIHCIIYRIFWVLFENRPALYFCNYIFITPHKLYNFGYHIKDTVYFFYCQ